MDRKGDVPTALVIPVTLILVILALFYFFSFNTKVQSSSKDVAEVVSSVHFYESYVSALAVSVANETVLSGASDLKEEYQKRIAARDLALEGSGNFFGKVRTGDFVFEEKDRKIVFEVRGLFVQSSRGLNSLKREFEIVQMFEKNKDKEKK